MKLRVRLLVVAVLAAVPVSALIYAVNEHMRQRDMRLALDRFLTAQLTDDTRERCDTNANWFLAGPRPPTPSREQLSAPDADVTAPRPPTQDLPMDFFAYDGGFQPLSTAGPRFPSEFRTAMRGGAKKVFGTFPHKDGAGHQVAVFTEWTGSPCAVLLFRIGPVPNQTRERLAIAAAVTGLLLLVAFIPGLPLIARARRLGAETKRSASEEYKSTIEVGGHDEMSSIAFTFNEAAANIRKRATDVKDREDSLRRYITNVNESVADPVAALEQRLSSIDRLDPPAAVRAEVNAAVADAHGLSMRLQNLAIGATLKMSMESPSGDVIDLPALVQRVIDRQTAFARAMDVRIEGKAEGAPITTAGNADLVEQIVNNLVDNAIRYNRPGGHVVITLDRTRDGRFSLRVADDGPGAPDDVLGKLNAIHRFRGDEGRSRRPGELGLGLAIVREVADRLGIKWAFRRSAKGWFEAELNGPIK
jgi:signal transduction histidine kinase